MKQASEVNWNEWTAIGTLILALVTVLAVGVTLWTSVSERKRADQAVAAEIARDRAERRRGRQIDLMLQLGRALGELSRSPSGTTSTAFTEVAVLLRILPTDVAALARQAHGFEFDNAKLTDAAKRWGRQELPSDVLGQLGELGEDIARVIDG